MIGSIVVVGALTCCALLNSVRDLKAVQMNVQRSLIREVMLYKFELGHKTAKATQNICCAKGEGAVTGWFKKFRLKYKKVDDRARSLKPISEHSDPVF